MFSIRRPIDAVVLNCWVTETKRRRVCQKSLDEAGEVGQRAGEAIDLIDDDHINLHHGPSASTLRDRWMLPPETTIVKPIIEQLPALMRLGSDVGLAGLTLRLE